MSSELKYQNAVMNEGIPRACDGINFYCFLSLKHKSNISQLCFFLLSQSTNGKASPSFEKQSNRSMIKFCILHLIFHISSIQLLENTLLHNHI